MTEISRNAKMLLAHMDVIASAVREGSDIADRYLASGAVRLEGDEVIFDKDKYLATVSACVGEIERMMLA